MAEMKLVMAAFTLFLAAEGAGAAQQTTAPPASAAQVQKLMDCRQLTDAAARLACFDREAAIVSQGIAARDLVVVDREAVRTTRRTLFGLDLPRIGLFDDGEKEAEIAQIEGVVESVGRNSDGSFFFFLEGGARWSQIDSRPIALEPERGDKVVIRRAALGSYMLSVNRQPGVRVRRVN